MTIGGDESGQESGTRPSALNLWASIIGNAIAAAVLIFLMIDGQFGALLIGGLFWSAVLFVIWLRRTNWND